MPLQFKKYSAEEFAQWLQNGKLGMCLVEHCPQRVYFKHRITEDLDILYMYRHVYDNTIAVDEEPEYQGIIKISTKELYDVGYETSIILKDTEQVMYGATYITDEIEEKVRTHVENMVAEYIETISENDIAEDRRKRLKDQAWETAKKRFLDDLQADDDYQCDYTVEKYHTYLTDFILNSDAATKRMAEEYHNASADEIREDVIRNRYTKEEMAKFNKNEYPNYTAMKKIIRSIPERCNTVVVTVRKEDKELTFKYEARLLRMDCGISYSTWYIPTISRCDFKIMFGDNADFRPEDISIITYGRKVLYEKE